MRISVSIAVMSCLAAFDLPAHAQPAPAPQPSLADTVVTRYCAAWGTVDPAAREALLSEVWAEGAEYVDPQPVRVAGRKALTGEILRFQRENPGTTFRCSATQAHHNFVRYTWVMVRANGAEGFRGMDFGEINSAGRFERIVSFFGAPPSTQ
jgi:SnoaL-like protein